MATPDTATRPPAAPSAVGVIPIEQALYRRHAGAAPALLRRSPGFAEDWLPAVGLLLLGFGERPAGVTCPAAVFARPLGSKHVAVVQAADRGVDDAGRPGALGFRLLVLPRDAYAFLGGDPVSLADAYPPSWEASGRLAWLSC